MLRERENMFYCKSVRIWKSVEKVLFTQKVIILSTDKIDVKTFQ